MIYWTRIYVAIYIRDGHFEFGIGQSPNP